MHRILSAMPRLRGLPAADWAPRHRVIVLLTAAHLPVLFAMALAAGMSVPHSLADVAPIALMIALATTTRINQSGRSCFAALGLVTCSAVLVHVCGGSITAHFHFFVVLPIIGLYGDWRPFLVAVVTIILHHAVGSLLMPGSVFPATDSAGQVLGQTALHAGFVIVQVIALMASWKLAERQMDLLDERNRDLDARTDELDASLSDVMTLAAERQGALASVQAMANRLELGARTVLEAAGEIQRSSVTNRDATSSQSDAMRHATEAVARIRDGARSTAEEAGHVAAEAEGSHRLTEQGAAAFTDVLAVLAVVEEDSRSSVQSIAGLEDAVRHIGQITDTVEALAEQSRLLSLNASIEAARAGPHGRGFAVVAEAVRELAQRSRASTEPVAAILGELRAATAVARSAAERSAGGARDGAARARDSVGLLDEAASGSSAAAQRAAQIAEMARRQREELDEVSRGIAEAAAGSRSLATASESAAEVARDLSRLASNLEAVMDR